MASLTHQPAVLCPEDSPGLQLPILQLRVPGLCAEPELGGGILDSGLDSQDNPLKWGVSHLYWSQVKSQKPGSWREGTEQQDRPAQERQSEWGHRPWACQRNRTPTLALHTHLLCSLGQVSSTFCTTVSSSVTWRQPSPPCLLQRDACRSKGTGEESCLCSTQGADEAAPAPFSTRGGSRTD